MTETTIVGHREGKGMMKSKCEPSAGPSLLAMLFLAMFIAGCGGGPSGSNSAPASTEGIVQTYQGVSNFPPTLLNQVSFPPAWTFVLGETESSFRYNNLLEENAASGLYGVVSGTYTSDNGYLALTSLGQPLAAQGYALVVPGSTAALRPGNSTVPPVVAAAMNNCPVISSSETLLFVALPGTYWNPANTTAYGSIQASADSAGATWSFSNQSQSLLAGSGSVPAYPASFTGTCGQGINGYNIGVVSTVAWPYYSPTISVSAGGFFTETATGSPATTPAESQQPLVGVVAPSSALDPTSMVAAKYIGFMYESLPKGAVASLTTQIVSFGSGSGSTMTGGVFPNDDPSQPPAANITVNFGAQSATQNGLFTGVTVTIPDTSTVAGTCAKNGGTPGKTLNGSLTCGFNAVAVAGNPNTKFAVFLIGEDPTQQAPFGLYLYQQ